MLIINQHLNTCKCTWLSQKTGFNCYCLCLLLAVKTNKKDATIICCTVITQYAMSKIVDVCSTVGWMLMKPDNEAVTITAWCSDNTVMLETRSHLKLTGSTLHSLLKGTLQGHESDISLLFSHQCKCHVRLLRWSPVLRNKPPSQWQKKHTFHVP